MHDSSYSLSGKAHALIDEPNSFLADSLKLDPGTGQYDYNKDYQLGSDIASQGAVPKFSAIFGLSPDEGTTITDPVTQTSLTFKPKFSLKQPRKDQNRLIYPLKRHSAVKVVSLSASGIKEDIILNRFQGDELNFKYELALPEGTEARLESNGSLAIYGAEYHLLGDVATGSESDKKLLEQARKNAPKSNLLFTFPAPFIKEYGKHTSKAKAWFSLEKNELTIHTAKLKDATYPLSIDPSVYIETAEKLMRGNNETNIDFDIDNELIQKSQTTGARIDDWTSTLGLNEDRWNGGVTTAGGYVYSVGGVRSNVTSVAYSTAGSDTFVVPSGVSSITVKMWGGGGGGGGGGDSGDGGNGGGAGFAQATLSVTPSETLNVNVGGGGGAGDFSSGGSGSLSGDGGGGGGHSELDRSGTSLLVAAGGGGGGGGDNTSSTAGGTGGAGGGTTGVNGGASSSAPGGDSGTQSSEGSGGNGSANDGADGGSEQGGDGANGGPNNGDGDGSANNGGTSSGGDGGNGDAGGNGYGAGGGGGSGYFGGGGGSGSIPGNAGGGGGGGGSSYTTGTNVTNTAGSGANPGNASDSARSGAGEGGSGGNTNSSGIDGTDGRVIISYSTGGSANEVRPEVYWAHFNTSNNTIESPNPGDGTCTNWCTDSSYDLPDERAGHSLVTYNGFLYAIGGYDDSGTRSDDIYIAKLGGNGELSLWHPTDTNPDNWVYWYQSSGTDLSSERSYAAAAAYNNRLYVLGGQTDASPSGVTTVEVADILPTGSLGSWTTTGMQALPSGAGRHMHNVQIYNDTIYAIGGLEGAATSSANLRSTVYYSKLNNDGSMNSWQSTNGFTSARSSFGGTFTSIFGAYIYLGGGCTAVNASGYCTTIASDMQLASINADGSIGEWSSLGTITNSRIGYNLNSWQGRLYRLGGCGQQDSSTGDCIDSLSTADYGAINPSGEVSTVNLSSPSGSGSCTGGSPHSCDLPPPGDDAGEGGQMLSMSTILNGYLYLIGGCIDYDCNGTNPAGDDDDVSGNISYVAIDSNGRLIAPSSCSGTSYGAWCVDSTNRINGTTGVAAAGVTTFNNRIYVVGGLTGSGNSTNIYYNSVNSDGSLAGAWSGVDMTTAGISEDVSYTYAYARANPSSAGTNPGNLFVFGGCGTNTGGAGCGSNDYETEVYKCNITTSGSVSGCTTSGQLQIDSTPGSGGTDGLGIHSGTVYANYIFLVGGYSQAESDKDDVLYAQFDDSNNVVAVTGSDWVESSSKLSVGRRRGFAFGYNGHIYAIGGYDNSGAGIIPFIEWSKMNVSDGSIDPFVTSGVTINQRWGLSMIVSNGYAYVLGGCDSGASPNNCNSFESAVQTFQLYNNNSGSPAGYSAGANLFATDRLGASAAVLDGYIYVAGGCTAVTSGVCTSATDNVQYASLDAYGNVGSWSDTSDSTLPATRAFGQLEAAGDTLYYIGGQGSTATDESAAVYYGTPSSGDVSAWNTASNGLPAARTQHSATAWNGRIYVTGGLDGSANSTNTVYASPDLSSGGNITSAWTSTGMTSFNVARSGHTTIAYANNLYVFGGYDGSNYLSDSQFTQINPDGTIDSWSYTTSLPVPLRQADGFAANGYMYILGGRSGDTTCNPKTLIAPISANTTIASGNNPTGIGEWYETNAKYVGDRYGANAVYDDGTAYLLGGACESGSQITHGTYTFDSDNGADESAWTFVADNGTNGLNNCSNNDRSWDYCATDTPSSGVGPTSGEGGVDGYVYTEASQASNGDTYHMTLDQTLDADAYDWDVDFYWNQRGNGNITTLRVQTNEDGAGWVTRGTYGDGTYGGPPDVGSNGSDVWRNENLDLSSLISDSSTQVRFHVTFEGSGTTWNKDLGLDSITVTGTAPTTTTFTGASRIVQTSLLSQPQVAKYSRMIDTNTDVFPNYWLMNGLDNSIGARWTARYRSMNDTDGVATDCGTADMSTWGQDTNYGDVTLGDIAQYIPLDGSGNNINCARFFYFFISIDASKTFGYPEDVNRGPTIADFSLSFTSDPSKRLRHGKTFTEGAQQPLDTPCRQSNDPDCPLP